jgi:hypothetical protein
MTRLPPRMPHHPLNPIQPLLQHLHAWPIAQPHKVMTRTIEQIPPLRRVQIEEDPRHDNHPLLEQRIEEGQPIRDVQRTALRQWRFEGGEIEPDVEGRVRRGLVLGAEPDLLQPLEHVVALDLEMPLQCDHLPLHLGRVQHADRCFLEGDVRPAV